MSQRSTNPGSRRPAAALVTTLVCAVVVTACCVSGAIKLGRIKGFLSGVFELSGEAELTGTTTYSFDGELGAWADIPSFDLDELDVDISTASYYRGFVEFDVDYDASEERIEVLRAEGAGSTGALTVSFFSWGGDKYTLDKNVCYLGWAEGGDVYLSAAYCGETTGAMYCRMPGANEDNAYCESCDEGGSCSSCSMKKDFKECLPAKAGGGSIDLDIDIDIDIDVDMDADQHAEG